MLLLYVALALICIHFLGNVNFYRNVGFRIWMGEGPAEFKRLGLWTGVNLLFYLFIPGLIIRFGFRESVSDYGLRYPRGNQRLYLWFFLLMVPLVFAVSFLPAFQQKYPFYQLSPGEKAWPWFYAWELLYLFQFLGLEFFFRGFMVLGLKPSMGMQSVLVMVVPYSMIHFSKPMPEAIGSVAAGLVLGYLSYRKSAVIPGAILHFSVALLMDLLALWQKGLL